MKTVTFLAVAVIAAGSATAQTVDFPPPTYNRVIIPVAAAPSAPAYLIPNPIGVNERGEVLFWTRQTSGKPMPANREWYTVYKWLPGAASSSLVTTFGDENGRYPTWMPRHGFNNAGQFAVMRQYYAPQIGFINALGTWSGDGWNDFWATTIGPTYPGYPHTPYDMNSAGDVVFASYVSAMPDMLWIVAGGIIEKYAGRGGGAIYQASSGMVRFFFPGTTNTCLPLRINNAGMAVGIVTGNSLDFQYTWRGFTGTFAGGATEFAFPGPRGGVTQPTGINGAGEIVGLSGNFPLGWAPFIYLPAPKYGLTAGLHEIAPATPSTAEPSHLDENNRFLSHEALINDSGQVIFNYHNFAHGTPGFWQLGHPWTLTSMVGNFVTNESITFAQDINNRGEILAVMHPTRQTVLLRPLLAARLTLQTETCPGGAFTLRLTVTNQSGRPLTQLAAPLLEWNGTGSFTILDPATVSGPSPLPDGQTADITWRVQVSGGLPDGSFVSQGTARDATNAVINSFLAQSPPIGDFFHTGVTALPNRVGIGKDIQVRVTAFNGTTKTLLNVRPDGVPSPSATGRVQFKSGPVPASSVTLNPGASFTFTNVFTATNSGTVEFSANVVGTCDGSPITAASGTGGTVRIADRGDLLIKRADESASLYGINDEYQLNPAGAQVRTNTVWLGKVSEFNLQVQNDETNSQIFSLKADESGHLGWYVKYLLNTVDISAAVRAASGTSLPELAGGASHTLTVQMAATNAVAGDRKSSLLVLGNPLEPGEILDVVQAVTDLAAEIIVNSTGDEPDASLTDGVPDVNTNKPGLQTTFRCAIDFANRRAGPDVIKFEIPANDPSWVDGVPQIEPQTALPEITGKVVIDGWSQNPNSDKPAVALSGRLLPRPQLPYTRDLLDWPGAASGLNINASDCDIRGLIVVHFPLCGILLRGPGNHVYGNYIGLARQGSLPAANGLAGSILYDTALGTTYPAHIRGAGICILSSGNFIGGPALRDRNVIFGRTGTINEESGNIDYYAQNGPPEILIRGATASLNQVQGNILGLDPAGARVGDFAPPSNYDYNVSKPRYSCAGIWIEQGASQNLIGGNDLESGNVIAGASDAVVVADSPNNTISGNVIGRDASEENEVGILSIRSPGTLIGGDLPSSGNVIANFLLGISVSGPAGSPCIVRNNQIGISSAGLPLGGLAGIYVAKGAWTTIEDNIIAHNDYGLRFADDPSICRIVNNVIRDNEKAGVFIHQMQAINDIVFLHNTVRDNGSRVDEYSPTTFGGIVIAEGSRITLRENSIYNNGGLGIRLGVRQGPLLDDIGDLDSGPNTLLNHPILFPVRLTTGVINGRLTTAQSLGVRTYRVELFASARASSTGHGEGERFVGAVDVDIGIAGESVFSCPIPPDVSSGSFITATTTDSDGNTSEFSKAVQACSGNDSDHDGICDELEAAGPGGGDANGDGTPDSNQPHVTSFNGITGKWLTLRVANGLSLQNVAPTGSPDFASLPVGYALPYGFVSLTLTGLAAGATATLTNLYQDAVGLTTVFAYGPTSGSPQPHWYELTSTISSNAVRVTFTDGGAGDLDMPTNGIITTIYALAYPLPPVPQLSVSSFATSLATNISVYDSGTNFLIVTNMVTLVRFALAWPATATNYVIESTETLAPANWLSLRGTAVIVGDQLVVTNSSISPARFYRLRPGSVTLAQAPAPKLNIQRTSTNTLLLSWPASFTGFVLQQSTNLVTGTWTSVTNSIIVTNGQNQVLVTPAAGSRFFRLKSQ